MRNNLHIWELGLAVVGYLLWMLALVSAKEASSLGFVEVHRFISGYALGFIIPFSGYMFWEVIQGRGHKFLDNHPVIRWFSYLMLAFIFLFGLISLSAEIFGNTNWAYNIGSLLGGLVVALGVIPTIEKLYWSSDKQFGE